MAAPSPHISRTVFCEDAVNWLRRGEPLIGTSLVSSLPDISEFGNQSLAAWKEWFIGTAALILEKTPPEGVSIFYQTDIKHEGTWVDKGYLCQRAAEEQGCALLWHKMVCRAPPGNATFGRPGYSHILCFSRSLRLPVAASTADVLPELGDKAWNRGMGLDACLMIAKFIAQQTNSRTVINPFCGKGSMLAAANAVSLCAVGIERSPKRAEEARRLTVSIDTGRLGTDSLGTARGNRPSEDHPPLTQELRSQSQATLDEQDDRQE
jgi:hypothetical protein